MFKKMETEKIFKNSKVVRAKLRIPYGLNRAFIFSHDVGRDGINDETLIASN
jgi:hypothetical protein|tara:strand:- start:497 stop:652 length:156 start_codon:yes stop_codon:yes gene_type:complete